MADVVKLKAPKPDKRRIDLRGNNRLPELLETYVEQAAIIAEAMKLKKEAETEVKELIGDAEYVLADGFTISVSKFHVKEHVVKASDRSRMIVRPRFARR